MKISIQTFAIAVITCFALLSARTTVSAQTSIYSQNFDAAYAWPSGWSSSGGSWTIDSTNSSTGYTGASGLNNVVVQNVSSPSGHDTLYSKIISTVGYTSISAIWAARNTTHFPDSGSNIKGFYWSTNEGTTWNQVTYTENTNNSTWAIDNNSTVISLPGAVANNPSVQFAWIAHIYTAPSGTYRIDDFNVDGTPGTGIAPVSEDLAYVYCINSSIVNIVSHSPLSENLNIEIYDVTGNVVNRSMMNQQSTTINASAFSSGMYFVRVSNSTQSSVSKIFIR
jgi:type IX secretion system substrate protein